MAGKKSTKQISKKLIDHLSESFENIDGWGSVEIIIQDNRVTQITEKNIKKPSIDLE